MQIPALVNVNNQFVHRCMGGALFGVSDLEKGGHLQQIRATIGQCKEVEAGLVQARQGLSIVVQGTLQQAGC